MNSEMLEAKKKLLKEKLLEKAKLIAQLNAQSDSVRDQMTGLKAQIELIDELQKGLTE